MRNIRSVLCSAGPSEVSAPRAECACDCRLAPGGSATHIPSQNVLTAFTNMFRAQCIAPASICVVQSGAGCAPGAPIPSWPPAHPSARARLTVAREHTANTRAAVGVCICVTVQCERMQCRRRGTKWAADCFARSVRPRARAGDRAQ